MIVDLDPSPKSQSREPIDPFVVLVNVVGEERQTVSAKKSTTKAGFTTIFLVIVSEQEDRSLTIKVTENVPTEA